MNDEQFNVLLNQLRHGLMPTFPVEEMFNLTLKVERPIQEHTDGGETNAMGWETVDDLAAALDDYPQREIAPNLRASYDQMRYTLYCPSDANIRRGDRVTLWDEKGAEMVLRVEAVSNPMMRYRYLAARCTEWQIE